MLKKKWLSVTILVVIILVIGGSFYMNKEKENTNILETEKLAAKVLKNEFKDINIINFKKIDYDSNTGTYGIRVILTTEANKSLEFSYTFWKESNKMGGYVLLDKDVQKKGITTDPIKVIYLNGEEDVI